MKLPWDKRSRGPSLPDLPSEIRVMIFEYVLLLEMPSRRVQRKEGTESLHCCNNDFSCKKPKDTALRRLKTRLRAKAEERIFKFLTREELLALGLIHTRHPCSLRHPGRPINLSILYLNRRMCSEALGAFDRISILIIPSQPLVGILAMEELRGLLRHVVIREQWPQESLFVRPPQDRHENQRMLCDLLTAPRLESLVIDIEPFYSRRPHPAFIPGALDWFLESFAIGMAITWRCTGIGQYELISRTDTDFLPILAEAALSRGVHSTSPAQELDVLPINLDKIKLEHRSVINQWSFARRANKLELEEIKRLERCSMIDSIAARKDHNWLTRTTLGDTHWSCCKLLFWKTLCPMAWLCAGIRQILPEDGLASKRKCNRMLRHFVARMENYGESKNVSWGGAWSLQEEWLISPLADLGNHYAPDLLLPGIDKRLDNLWSLYFACLVHEKRVSGEFQSTLSC